MADWCYWRLHFIQVPKSIHPHSKSMLSLIWTYEFERRLWFEFYLCPYAALQLVCMGAFDQRNDCGDHRQLSTCTTGLHSNTLTLRIVWFIEPCFLGHCIVLHHIRVCSQLGRSGQLVSFTPIVATDQSHLLCNLFTAFSSAINYGGFDENSALFHRIDCLPNIPCWLCDYYIHIHNSIVGIWIANCSNWKNIVTYE